MLRKIFYKSLTPKKLKLKKTKKKAKIKLLKLKNYKLFYNNKAFFNYIMSIKNMLKY